MSASPSLPHSDQMSDASYRQLGGASQLQITSVKDSCTTKERKKNISCSLQFPINQHEHLMSLKPIIVVYPRP